MYNANKWLENKALKSEIEQMMLKIENKPIDFKDTSLHHDFVTIISNSEESEMPLFMKFFWDDQINVFLHQKAAFGIIHRLFDIAWQ